MSVQAEYVRCGKRCGTCPHGPYWYEYWREGKRVKKRYVGKVRPKSEAPPVEDPDDAIFDRRRASLSLAKKILGIEGKVLNRQVLDRQYRKLAMLHHPDKGGDARKFSRINTAASYARVHCS